MRTHAYAETMQNTAVKYRNIVLGVMIVLLLFTVVYVRHLCVKTGYEISTMTNDLENKEVSFQAYMEKKSRELDKESLYRKAEEIGMVLYDPMRTFNVR